MNCQMSHFFMGEVYCDYYDFGCRRCEDVVNCPAENEDDEGDYEDE